MTTSKPLALYALRDPISLKILPGQTFSSKPAAKAGRGVYMRTQPPGTPEPFVVPGPDHHKANNGQHTRRR